MPPSISQIISYADNYNQLLEKIAYIRKRKGKWVILSEKGKQLGSYDTKADAVKRLRQIEYFKSHKKASKDETYSSIMRDLVKKDDQEAINNFRSTFKDSFDKAYMSGEERPEEIAFEVAKNTLDKKAEELNLLIKQAQSSIDLGAPEEAGKTLAAIIRWMMQRISPQGRQKALQNMKKKIYFINEFQVASKRAPPSSSMGQAITLTKTMLLSKDPQYIRATLNNIVKYL